MPTARKNHVSLDATPYYHCIGRCVRRAFLWGEDPISGQDFSHRKRWVTERLAELSRSFAVNICAYAVMSNHYHLVLHLDAAQARSWSEAEVAHRWELLFSLPLLLQKYLKDELTIKAEIRVANYYKTPTHSPIHPITKTSEAGQALPTSSKECTRTSST